MRTNPGIKLETCPGTYTIHRLQPDQEIPEISHGFHCIVSAADEISVVCLDEIEIPSGKKNSGWKCLRVAGTLDLDLTGILHDITAPLKSAGISVFAISTYNTDYLLVPGKHYSRAIEVLSGKYTFRAEPSGCG